jgi:gamma-glutamyltranspeptidase/glutathione hydrolase
MKLLKTLYYSTLFAGVILLASCKKSVDIPIYNITKTVIDDSSMVVSAHPEATRIGLDILKQGGNAVDAAIAVQFALGVCYPVAGNIGGGGFMVLRTSDGEAFALDYREKAPGSATYDMYLDDNGDPIDQLSTRGHLAAGVPGSVDGMVEAFNKFSKLNDWKALVQPSVDLARNGYKATERQARGYNSNKDNFEKHNTRPTVFTAQVWKEGDLVIQEDLAKTLEYIRDYGRAGFYEGPVADLIVAEMERGNGIITHEDLKAYNSVWRTPIQFDYRNHQIISMPPPSSGGVVLAQMMKTVEPYDISSMGFHSTEAVHLMIEAERRSYADRSTHLGDGDYYDVPLEVLLSDDYISSRFADYNPNKASISSEIEAGIIESEETTHYSVLDHEGNAVSVTTTLNGGFGSKTVVGGAGFLLNNEMDDFSIKPGVPNMYGLVGAEANKIEPGKRMLSSMTPTIVVKNNKPYIVVGTPGGSTIITSVFQTIVNIIDFGMTASEAVQAPRFHHQWQPDEVMLEDDALSLEIRSGLEKMGHKLNQRGKIGRVEAILINVDGTIEGAADTRGDDDAKGY